TALSYADSAEVLEPGEIREDIAKLAKKALDENLVDLDGRDRKSTRLNSSHVSISYAVFCLKKKKTNTRRMQGIMDTRSAQLRKRQQRRTDAGGRRRKCSRNSGAK